MKKARITGLIVLLILAMVSCGGFLTEPENETVPTIVDYTSDGRAIMELTIGTPQIPRALTDTLAQSKANYYEVAFLGDNGTVYRKMWDKADTARIRVPVGDYTGAGKAILFAGRKSDKTLLAVGIISQINGNPIGTNAVIDTSTTSVTFTLFPLLSNIDSEVAYSSFEITGLAGTLDKTGTGAPIHAVAKNTQNITASYTIEIDENGVETQSHYEGMVIDLAAGAFSSRTSTSLNEEYSTINVENLIIAYDSLATNSADGTFPSNGKFALTFDTPDLDGFVELFFDIPVYALSDTASAPTEWFIRGGLDNTAFDLSDFDPTNDIGDSEGGAILLGIGDALETTEVIINP